MHNGFAQELAILGPEGRYVPFSVQQARAYCRRLAESHYENFSVASLLLPRRLMRHFHAVYAYCSWADDLGDETGGGERALALLAWWREQLAQCYAGKPHHPVMVALAETIQRFAIPPEPFTNLIEAFEQDQRVKRYETFAQLEDYCRRSANPVGRLVLYLCETFDEEKAALSDKICTGLQLANFWQDVSRDLDIGRIYLPMDDMRRFEYREEDLQARRFTPAFGNLLQFEVKRAKKLFHEGSALIPLVPDDVRIDIELFLRGGLGILDKIRASDYDVLTERPVLRKWDKAALLGRVVGERLLSRVW